MRYISRIYLFYNGNFLPFDHLPLLSPPSIQPTICSGFFFFFFKQHILELFSYIQALLIYVILLNGCLIIMIMIRIYWTFAMCQRCSKCCRCITSFNLHKNPLRERPYYWFYRWGCWSLERLSKRFKFLMSDPKPLLWPWQQSASLHSAWGSWGLPLWTASIHSSPWLLFSVFMLPKCLFPKTCAVHLMLQPVTSWGLCFIVVFLLLRELANNQEE